MIGCGEPVTLCDSRRTGTASRRASKHGAELHVASIVSADRVVFDILTNWYRLVTAVDFEKGFVWIKWIGTHKEYDKIDAKKVTYARH